MDSPWSTRSRLPQSANRNLRSQSMSRLHRATGEMPSFPSPHDVAIQTAHHKAIRAGLSGSDSYAMDLDVIRRRVAAKMEVLQTYIQARDAISRVQLNNNKRLQKCLEHYGDGALAYSLSEGSSRRMKALQQVKADIEISRGGIIRAQSVNDYLREVNNDKVLRSQFDNVTALSPLEKSEKRDFMRYMEAQSRLNSPSKKELSSRHGH